ncbi:MAG TPA: Ppx/GppA phosphatase family protein [Acidimicrobiales bacterium]|nr:Ppx/GppA phosphatase family protein [Acidimicrobiales bacterium]
MPAVRVAAIDCGSNSTRLLVREERNPRPLTRRMQITRLGEGVDRSRRLDAAAIQRTVAVLREYRSAMDDLGVTSFRATATSAARDATNREEFFSAAEAALGAPPELLGGDEEGRLSFLGATAELDPDDGPFLVVDIGGGSTEFVVGTGSPSGVTSIDIGCVRLTEKFLRSDPPTPEELSQAISVVRAHLDDVKRELPEAKEARRLVGLAGTVTTMAAVEIGLQKYDPERIHHFVLTRAAAEDVFRTLATEPLADRIHNPGLEEARADVIVGGAAILVAIMRQLGFDECLVSESDILDGLVMSQLGADAEAP